jgi:SRSO17 transposase
VGVAPQYCGVLGKWANGQVAVTTTYGDPVFSWPVNGQIYLPQERLDDAERCKHAHIPPAVTFQTKPEIALALIDQARQSGVPFDVVVADGGYGDNPAFLDGLAERQVPGVVGVHRDFGVRVPSEVAAAAAQPLPPKRKLGRPRTRPHPVQVAPVHRADALLAAQAEDAWQTISWRQGSDGPLAKRFRALWVHRAVGDQTGPVGWLIGECSLVGEIGEPKQDWSDLDEAVPLARLAELAHRRPSIEQGYEDGKSLTGLGADAARSWESFHRHLTLEFLVLSWLVLQDPPPSRPTITPEPQPLGSPDEPVFPLRPGTLPQSPRDSPHRLRLPRQRAFLLADSLGPTRSHPATGPTPLGRFPGALSQPIT